MRGLLVGQSARRNHPGAAGHPHGHHNYQRIRQHRRGLHPSDGRPRIPLPSLYPPHHQRRRHRAGRAGPGVGPAGGETVARRDCMNSDGGLFQAAFPFNKSELELPVQDIDQAAGWYARAFGLIEVDRTESPLPSVTLERDGVRLGFAVTGGAPVRKVPPSWSTISTGRKMNWKQMALRRSTGGLTSVTGKSCKCSSSSLPMDCATTSTSR